MKSYTYSAGSQIRCPYCDSIQIKSMANQPKKYPYPDKSKNFHSQESLEQLRQIWRHGYDCKKCGNEFVAIPEIPKQPKRIGFFGKLFVYIFWLIVLFFVAIYFVGKDKPDSIAKVIDEKQSNHDLKYEKNDPTPLAIEKTDTKTDTDTNSTAIENAATKASTESSS